MSTMSAFPLLREAMAAQLEGASSRTSADSHAEAKASLFARAVWRALERIGQLRARRHLLDLAWQYDATDPDLARQLRGSARRIAEG